MAQQEHLDLLLKKGVKAWNKWRDSLGKKRFRVTGDLYRAELWGRDLTGADFRGVNLGTAMLSGAKLTGARFERSYLENADLSGATLDGTNFWRAHLMHANCQNASFISAKMVLADMREANLAQADFSKADMRYACFRGSNLWRTNFTGADLRNANLKVTQMVSTNFNGANLTGAYVYGASTWGIRLHGTSQQDLVVTTRRQSRVTVDSLQIAQFIYLLLNSKTIRDVVDSVTTKLVLVLGRFSPERKAVLRAVRDSVATMNYSPVLFDFDPPSSRDISETVSILAHMSKFIIADLTDARAVPQELVSIVPMLPSVPVLPLLACGSTQYAMFDHLKRYPWVMETFQYQNADHLLENLSALAERTSQKAAELKP